MPSYTDDDECIVERVLLYSRQSKASKASIQRQDQECLADSERQGWPEPERYSDGTSASRYSGKRRDDWERVVEQINAVTFDPRRRTVLLLWESSRGDRDPATWFPFLALCRVKGVLIRVTTDRRTYNLSRYKDYKTISEDGLDSANESEKMAMRVRSGILNHAQDGYPHAKAAFGYRRTYRADGEFQSQVIDDQPRWTFTSSGGVKRWTPVEVVQHLYHEIEKGIELTVLARRLNNAGIPTPRQLAAAEAGKVERMEKWANAKWTRQTVRQLVLQRVYLGERVHSVELENGVRTKPQVAASGKWQGLVGINTFTTVERLLKDPKRRTVRDCRAVHLLSYLARCECGEYLQVRYGMGYKCMNNHTYIQEPVLDQYVLTWLALRLSKPENFAHMQTGNADEAAEARDAATRKRQELEGWLRDAENPDEPAVDREVYKRQYRRLTPEIERLEAKARAAQLPPVLAEHIGPSNAGKILDCELATQRDVIRLVVDITVRRPTKRGRHAEPVEWRTRLEPR